MNPNSRRRRRTGACAWRTARDGSRTIGAGPRNSGIEHDKSDLSLFDGAVSLRSFKAKDGEERIVVGKGDVSLYAVEDERQGFSLGDDDDCAHSSDSSLDLLTPLW